MNRVLTLREPRRLLGRTGPMRTGETTRVLPLLVPVTGAALAGLAAAVVSLVADTPSSTALLGVFGLLVATVVAEAFPLPIEGVSVGSMSLATVFIVASAVLYSWPSATVVAFLAMVTVEFARRRPVTRAMYNTALYVVAALVAGVVADSAGGDELLSIVVGTMSAAVAFYAVDIVLLAGVVSLARAQPFPASMRDYLYSTIVPFLIMASFATTLVVLWDRSPFVTIVLIGPVLTIAFYQRWLHGALSRLREFDRLKDEFIAVISHELRTPLTSVYGAAMTLQREEVDDEMRESLVAIISSESGRLARLLDQVLWASRLDTGRDETVIVPTDAARLVSEVVEASRSRLPEGLAIELVAPERIPRVKADPDKLRQVLLNLVENAIKYSPEGGRITVDLHPSERTLRMSVRDEGIGIPAEEQERIFDKFHRLDPNMTRGVGGTGLGLYISRELVERMHGRIWVTSAEGRGSTFAFDLPLDRAA